jgi:YegS/Rv2252/BmrU family lipid kinase
MPRRVCVIVNPSAGGGRAERGLPAVESALLDLDVSFHTERTRDIEHAVELARAAAAAGEVAAAMGGDGLIGAVAGALRGTEGVLGILPGGRGNDFGRVLGIPRELPAACRVLAEGTERQVDLGEVDGRLFIGIASTGLDSDANRIANEAPPWLGGLVYAYGALRALAAWTPARFDLELDGEHKTFTGYSVAAANSKAYGGGMYLAPDAELDDGMLDVVVVEAYAKRRAVARMPKLFKGTHVKDPEVHVFRAKEVRIAADRAFEVYADGDEIGTLPATVRAVPRALRVLVPDDAGGSGAGS